MTTEPETVLLDEQTGKCEGSFYLVDGTKATGNISFQVKNETILILSEKGMTYKGTLIEDAGEAHRAFLSAMGQMYNQNKYYE